MRKYPNYICHDCGSKFCNTKAPVGLSATYIFTDCDCCKAMELPCTDPTNYNGLKEWPLPKAIDPCPVPENYKDLIQPVLNQFNFEKVHTMMNAANWQWIDAQNGSGIPSVDEMKRKAKDLLTHVVHNERYFYSAQGGFAAERINESNHMDSGLILQFIAAQSEVYFGDYGE